MKKLRIALLGKQGAGKSASGNTLLGCHSFPTAASSKRVTQACSMSFATVDQQMIEVIDTPGWGDSSQFETEMKPNIIYYLNEYKPHVFLLVLPIGRFTNEEMNTIMNILNAFGDEVTKYMIILFTKWDEMEKTRTIEDYLKEGHTDLGRIIQICGGRYHVFNNKEREDRQQISSLLKTINDLLENKEENHYTEAMYEKNKNQKREADDSVPEEIKSPAENEKSNDDQVSICDTDGKEKERGGPLVHREEFVKFMNKVIQKFQDCKEKMQFMEGQLTTMQGELDKTKNEMQQKADQKEQLQQE